MKHWLAFGIVILTISGAIVWSEVYKVEAPVGPDPILNLLADGERELTRLPVAFAPLADSEEIKIGKELEKSYATAWQRPEQQAQNRAIEEYVQQVGSRVASHAHRKLPYRFHYIPELDFINAFALPGGPVFIGGGLMALMETEDELAAVLGHEIEHIDHFHCAERIQVEAALRRIPLGGLVGLPVEIFVAGYSKNQELEADREGTRLAVAGSYSPDGAIRMFEAFERLYPAKGKHSATPQEELSEVARKTLEGYFRSHPYNAERIDQIRKMIAAGQLPAWTRMTPLPVAYLFLTERAWRSLQVAQVKPYHFVSEKEKRKREAERIAHYEEAVKLASQSLALKPDQPRAMEIVGVAKFGLGDYTAAAATYRKLLPDYPTFADGIRVYADEMAHQALEAQQYDKAAKLSRQSLELQPNQPEALKILAEAQFWTADFSGAAETCRTLKNMYPQAADEVRIYADRLAASYWTMHKYQETASLSAQSLELKPDQQEPLVTLAKAQFALANFSSAALAYRMLLDQDVSDIELVRGYADSLSATDLRPQTLSDVESWLVRTERATPALATQLRIELAGLMLMAGNEIPAKAIFAEAERGDQNVIAPEFLGRLGWWYYRAGKYDTARQVLSQSVALRPGNLSAQTAVAWNELEEHQLEYAIQRFTAAAADTSWSSPVMGRAIARWQAHQTEDALKDFESATKISPEWRNPRWVNALFPLSARQSVAEMDTEWQKRQVVHR
jgi:predicted Zn-dependent protease